MRRLIDHASGFGLGLPLVLPVQQVLNRIGPDTKLDQIYESTRHNIPPCCNLAEIALAFNAIWVRLWQVVRT